MTNEIKDGKLFRPETSEAADTTLRNRGAAPALVQHRPHNRYLPGVLGRMQRRMLGRGTS